MSPFSNTGEDGPLLYYDNVIVHVVHLFLVLKISLLSLWLLVAEWLNVTLERTRSFWSFSLVRMVQVRLFVVLALAIRWMSEQTEPSTHFDDPRSCVCPLKIEKRNASDDSNNNKQWQWISALYQRVDYCNQSKATGLKYKCSLHDIA